MALKIENFLLKGTKVENPEETESLYKPPEFQTKEYPDSIVIHYTAMDKFDEAVKVLKEKSVPASAHLIIGKNGQIKQLAPFNYRTWHAGISKYKERSGYNHFSIGIEIDNLGWLEAYDGYFSRPELEIYNIRVTEKDVVKKEHKNPVVRKIYWQKYTKEQIQTVVEICRLLKITYPIKEIVGHDDIAPERKQDPGPAFPMEFLVKEVFSSDRSDDEDPVIYDTIESVVAASKLNIRSAPDLNSDKVARPLNRGAKVEILEKSGEWLKVKTEIEGWVHSNYIQ